MAVLTFPLRSFRPTPPLLIFSKVELNRAGCRGRLSVPLHTPMTFSQLSSLALVMLVAPLMAWGQSTPLNHAHYTEALKAFRSGKSSSLESLKKPEATLETKRAAVDDLRERLVDEPDSPLAHDVASLLTQTDLATAKLLLAALAEAKATRATPEITTLATDAKSPLYHDAGLTLAEIGGAKAVTILASQAKEGDLDDTVTALSKISGPGVTDAFIKNIKDQTLATPGRIALIKAAVVRNNQKITATLCDVIAEDALRLEAQKGILKLGQVNDLEAIHQAVTHTDNASTKAALQRLSDKLEKARNAEKDVK